MTARGARTGGQKIAPPARPRDLGTDAGGDGMPVRSETGAAPGSGASEPAIGDGCMTRLLPDGCAVGPRGARRASGLRSAAAAPSARLTGSLLRLRPLAEVTPGDGPDPPTTTTTTAAAPDHDDHEPATTGHTTGTCPVNGAPGRGRCPERQLQAGPDERDLGGRADGVVAPGRRLARLDHGDRVASAGTAARSRGPTPTRRRGPPSTRPVPSTSPTRTRSSRA